MNELTGKVIEVVPPEGSANNCTIIRSLKSLRDLAGLTIEQMAIRLDLPPEAINELESENAIQRQYLEKYVHALGGALHLTEKNKEASDVRSLYCMRSDIAEDAMPANQLVLPIFEDGFTPGSREIVLSIHPRYCSMILTGEKTVELRRRFPVSGICGSIAYIYSTSPVQAMVGRVEILDVVKLPVNTIWHIYGREACIEQEDFDSYFATVAVGSVLKLRNPAPFSRPLKLAELRQRFGFEPPQSFVYAKADLIGALHDE